MTEAAEAADFFGPKEPCDRIWHEDYAECGGTADMFVLILLRVLWSKAVESLRTLSRLDPELGAPEDRWPIRTPYMESPARDSTARA
jgi:hypothetical protein